MFVVQNFELKQYEDSAAKVEVVEPILASGYVASHKVMSFDRSYENYFADIVKQSFERACQKIGDDPVVIYGAGVHTEQHLTLFCSLNIKAFADRDSRLWGRSIEGIPIVSPEQINQYANHVVISSKAFEDAIYNELANKYTDINLYKLYSSGEINKHYFDDMYQALLQEVESDPPDIIFYCPTYPTDCMPTEYWLKLKTIANNTKFISVWWDYDENEHSPFLQLEQNCLQWCDLCIENSNATRLNKMWSQEPPYEKHVNTRKVIFHPTIFDPKMFYVEKIEKQYPIAILGTAAGERKDWIDFLSNEFPDQFFHIGGVEHNKALLSIEDYAKALRQTLIVINTQTYPEREQCKGKVREALACGVLLFEQDNAQTRNLLKEGQGVVYFKSREQLKSKLQHFLDNVDLVDDLVLQGQKMWQSKMQCKPWVETILKHINNS